jgi:hypothetical protein
MSRPGEVPTVQEIRSFDGGCCEAVPVCSDEVSTCQAYARGWARGRQSQAAEVLEAVARAARVASAYSGDPKLIIDYGLHLRMYGERAPGGDETWREWDRMAEMFLRRRLCREHGHDFSEDPTACSTCRSSKGTDGG